MTSRRFSSGKRIEFKTTTGTVVWDEHAYDVTGTEDPKPPEGEGWDLVGSTMTEVRQSHSFVLWFWRREIAR